MSCLRYLLALAVLTGAASGQTLTQVSTASMIGAASNQAGATLQASASSSPGGVASGAQGGLVAGSAQTVTVQQPFPVSRVSAPAVATGGGATGGGGGGGGCQLTGPSSPPYGAAILTLLCLGVLGKPRDPHARLDRTIYE